MNTQNALLRVNELHVSVEDKEILHGIDLTIQPGETHVLMGPNGTGKSTLGYALIGNPRYQITEGSILFNGKDITEEPVDKRAKSRHVLIFPESPGSSGCFFKCFHPQRLRAAKWKTHPSVGL